MDEVVRIKCPSLTCRKVLAVPGSARGRTVQCKSCGAKVRIPGGSDARANPTASKGIVGKKAG